MVVSQALTESLGIQRAAQDYRAVYCSPDVCLTCALSVMQKDYNNVREYQLATKIDKNNAKNYRD